MDPTRYLPTYDGCFCCGQGNPAGLERRFRREGGKVVAALPAGPRQQGFPGRIHGGILATVLDEAMGWALACEERWMCVTVKIEIAYRKPVEVGGSYRVEAWAADAPRRRLWRAHGRIVDTSGAIFVESEGLYAPIPDETMAGVDRHLRYGDDVEKVFEPGKGKG